MDARTCSACQAPLAPLDEACPRCGLALRGSARAGASTRWVWIVLSVAAVVGLGVIAVLLARVLSHVDTARRNLQDAEARADIAGIERALEEYAQAHGAYPGGLEPLVVPEPSGRRFLSRQTVPKDPWGRAYAYESPVEGGHARPYVWCLGEDGVAGSEDDVLSTAMQADR